MRRALPLLLLAAACGSPHHPAHLPVAPPPAMTSAPDAGVAPPPTDAWTKPYPQTRRDDVVETHFGVQVDDPYRWLEDASQPEVQAWMKAQDDYARGELAKLPGRAAMVKRLHDLMYFDADDAPVRRGKRFFWMHHAADKEKGVVYWKDGDKGTPHALLDPMTWASDGSIALGDWWPSWDGKTVAYNMNANNADAAEMHFVDVASGKVLADVLPGTSYASVSWTPDSKTVYYGASPPVGGDVKPPDVVGLMVMKRHTLGDDPSKDAVVHDATHDDAKFLDTTVSRDGHWLIASISDDRRGDVYVEDLRAKKPAWVPLVVGKDAEFSVTAWKDRFYVLTNLDAPLWRAMKVDPKHLDVASWKTIVPEDKDATLQGLSVIGGQLALSYLRKASSEVELRDLDGKHRRAIAMPGTGTVDSIGGQPDDDTAYVAYESFIEPGIVEQLSVRSGKTRTYSRIKLPIDASSIVTDQVSYPSKDGTAISMFLVHKKDVTATGDNPTLLYGYGGFDVPSTPLWYAQYFVWLERGGVLAVANLRGGGEYGEAWHQAGARGNKQHVFDDFIAAAHWLLDNKWTRHDKLAIWGRSNGGLLTSTVTTQAPDLFAAVVCGVPLTDMVRFPLVGIGAAWESEYGSPSEQADFQWLYAYSPYHHVQKGTTYPPFLLLSADSDDRVDPMHARKFIAALQWANAGDAPIYLRIAAHGGHHGNDQVKEQIDQFADMYSFLWKELGVAAPE